MNTRARAVIIGSGIAGSSIAYHLTDLGWRDIAVLEQGQLISGTTSHAPGLVGQLRSSGPLTKLLMYSVSLYRTLQVDGAPGYFEVGSLRLASSKERLRELNRQLSFAKDAGLTAELISPKDAQKLFPLMSLDGVENALYLPSDGSARAKILAQALATAAQQRGAVFHADTRANGFELKNGAVRKVHTNNGSIEADVVVVAAGIWSPRIGQMAGVSIPLITMQHQYVMTEPLVELNGNATVANMRDPDNLVYFRQDDDSLVMGGYEHDPVPFSVDAIPQNANPTMQNFDAARFESLLAGARRRVPRLRDVRFSKEVNGLESFTPDGDFILGEAPNVRGFWVACGFCAHGVSGGGGVGKAIAEWIVNGQPPWDLSTMNIQRFVGQDLHHEEILRRTLQVYSTYYSVWRPGEATR